MWVSSCSAMLRALPWLQLPLVGSKRSGRALGLVPSKRFLHHQLGPRLHSLRSAVGRKTCEPFYVVLRTVLVVVVRVR